MSRGTPVRTFRVSDELWAEVLRVVEARNSRTVKDQWTVASFVLEAMVDKLDHMARGRKSRRRRKQLLATITGERWEVCL